MIIIIKKYIYNNDIYISLAVLTKSYIRMTFDLVVFNKIIMKLLFLLIFICYFV